MSIYIYSCKDLLTESSGILLPLEKRVVNNQNSVLWVRIFLGQNIINFSNTCEPAKSPWKVLDGSLVQLISLIIKLIITLNKNARGQKVPLILTWDIRKHVLRRCSAICLCPITSLYIHKILRRHYEELLVFQVLSWCTLNFSWETWNYMVWCWRVHY